MQSCQFAKSVSEKGQPSLPPSLPFSDILELGVLGRNPCQENDKGHQVPICPRKGGREGGLTLFTDTLCELTTLHMLKVRERDNKLYS